MCGIAGLFAQGGASRDWLRTNVSAMNAALRHRGPDGGGFWIDAAAGIALGHRRLAVLDMTDAASQPMISPSQRYVVTFNGEIYNFRDIRRSLESRGAIFRTGSDTEVALAAFEAWPFDDAIRAFDGMFALAVWDRQERKLRLARDRFGEKPLYWTRLDGDVWVFAFASELAALETLSGLDTRIDEEARAGFLDRGYVSAPRSIYSSVRKLPASHWMEVPREPRRYWRVPHPTPRRIAMTQAVEELDGLLWRAVESRSVSDVPLGVFLSGGIDSSAITACLPHARTFTIGFSEDRYDESAAAAQVAQRFGCVHESVIVSPREAMDAIPSLASVYSEPFADSSQIPSLLVAKLAAKSVRVVLAGEGGDELFAGYPRYRQLLRILATPRSFRRIAASVMGRVRAGEKLQILGEISTAHDLASMYGALMGGDHPIPLAGDPALWMSIHDLENYLPDDLLVKTDRATMSFGLEARAPFLDPRIVEFALSLPPELRQGKAVLRRLLGRKLPPQLLNRPKQGFRLPIAEWLRGPLRDWAEDLVPGIVATLPPGTRCVRAWSRLMWEAWVRRRAARVAPDRFPMESVPDPAGFV